MDGETIHGHHEYCHWDTTSPGGLSMELRKSTEEIPPQLQPCPPDLSFTEDVSRFDYFNLGTRSSVLEPPFQKSSVRNQVHPSVLDGITVEFKSAVEAKVSHDHRPVPRQVKRRDASIELHLKRHRRSKSGV
jgi:hypothetical protein